MSGLEGGHSGQQIDDNLTNALKALGYVLAVAAEKLGASATTHLRVVDRVGGGADNAIPREAQAVLLVDAQGRTALERAGIGELVAGTGARIRRCTVHRATGFSHWSAP